MHSTSVKENMSKSLITVHWNDPIASAHQLMEEHRIRHLPVLNSDRSVVGVLSSKDVSRAMDPKHPTFSSSSVVGDFMSWPAVTVSESASIREVAEGMVDEKISAFLVTRDTRIVGIVTSEDLLAYLAKMLREGETSRSFKEFSYTPAISELIREASSVGI